MKLVVESPEPLSPVLDLWRGALGDVIIRHHDPLSEVVVSLVDGAAPHLKMVVRNAQDNRSATERFTDLVISNVHLTYFPGTRLARQWLAAAWAGYQQHESLERVTVGDLVTRPLDPHGADVRLDRGLRCGLPTTLTPETLECALAAVMDPAVARELMEAP